jgi:hypothetical protein
MDVGLVMQMVNYGVKIYVRWFKAIGENYSMDFV